MIETFIKSLKKTPPFPHIFNPWWQVDEVHDLGKKGPSIRRRQLGQYLVERQKTAKYLLLGEALGYQGGHFSGMAMTSERILLGELKHKGVEPQHVFEKIKPERTSHPKIKALGFTEPTATIVWGHMLSDGVSPKDFVIWNAFPWHPYKSEKGYLSNRTPKPQEMIYGKKILDDLLEIMNFEKIVAIGQKAYDQLTEMGYDCVKVRHPANGGAGEFRRQMRLIAL